MTERTTVRLPENLLRRAKRKAARENRTLTSLIEEGLRAVVFSLGEGVEAARTPRVSEATGGLAPGVDLVKWNRLEEEEDIERLLRSSRQ